MRLPSARPCLTSQSTPRRTSPRSLPPQSLRIASWNARPYPRVERSARAAVHVRHRLAIGCDARAHVHAGKVRDGVVRLRRREDATDAQLGVLTMKVKERATVGTPDRVGGVKGRAVRPLDARDRAVAQRRDRDLVVAARVRGERKLRPVGRPARADGFADGAAAGLEAYGLAA